MLLFVGLMEYRHQLLLQIGMVQIRLQSKSFVPEPPRAWRDLV